MSRRKRTHAGIGVIELLLVGLWWWLAQKVIENPSGASPDAQVVIGRTIGGAMGVIAGLAFPLYLVARRNDLKGR